MSKEDRRKPSNNLRKVREAATKPIDPELGVSKHFISSALGDTEDDGETRETFIQDSYAMNIAKIKILNNRLIMYDMNSIFFVSTFVDGVGIRSLSNITNAWNDDGVDMMTCWEEISWETVCHWQLMINRLTTIYSPDRKSNTWATTLIYNSCTHDLREQIQNKCDVVGPSFRGAITYT